MGIVSLVWRRRGHPEDPPIRLHLAPRESVASPLLGFDNRLTQPRSCSGHGMDTSLEDRQLSQSVVLIASSRRASIFCLSTRDQSTVRHGRRTVLEPHTHTQVSIPNPKITRHKGRTCWVVSSGHLELTRVGRLVDHCLECLLLVLEQKLLTRSNRSAEVHDTE